MAAQDNLPIWARIILGLPVAETETGDAENQDAVRPSGASIARPQSSQEREATHSVLMFEAARDTRTARWNPSLPVMLGEF